MSKQRQTEAAKPETVGGSVDSNPAAPETAQDQPKTPSAPRVFAVEIPRCLLGKRHFVAADADDAYRQYKALGGINGHERRQIVEEVMPGCEAYESTIAAK